MRNQEIAEVFYEIADILEVLGEIQWKYLAYRKAARTIESLSENIGDILGKKKIPGVGKAIEEKITELLTTGKLKYLEDLKKEVPKIVVEMTEIENIGPKTAKLIYDTLKVETMADLEKAARSHRLLRVKGLGPKTEEAIIKGIAELKKPKRHLLGVILPIAEEICNELKGLKEVKQISVAGSIRRRRETIRDIDILITSDNPKKVMDFFTNLNLIMRVVAKGDTKSTVYVRRGIQVDLRVVQDESYGAALQYFTGSKEHNVHIRTMASQMGLTLSEYNLKNKETDEWVAGKTEEEIYKALGLVWMPPELREDRGEIEAAQTNSLPNLLDMADIRGDLHMHTNYSDGKSSIEEMVQAAIDRKYEYMAITDHTGGLEIANAIDEGTLLRQMAQIREIDAQHKDIRVLAGAEVNILPDGKLDMSTDVLDQLDIVIGSCHSKLKMPREEMTERVTSALMSEYLTILGHPTNRLINKRAPSDIDLIKVLDTAKAQGKILEINAYPPRLDLNDVNSRTASQNGILLVINTDSHEFSQLRFMELGVAVARRGWLERKDVLNARPCQQFLNKLGIK